MKEILETPKGRFIVTDMQGEVRINNVQWFLKLSEINELEAKSIVGAELNEKFLLITKDWYRYKLHSLLESQGIEITNNTYIFKVC